jgi:hypothetical protein
MSHNPQSTTDSSDKEYAEQQPCCNASQSHSAKSDMRGKLHLKRQKGCALMCTQVQHTRHVAIHTRPCQALDNPGSDKLSTGHTCSKGCKKFAITNRFLSSPPGLPSAAASQKCLSTWDRSEKMPGRGRLQQSAPSPGVHKSRLRCMRRSLGHEPQAPRFSEYALPSVQHREASALAGCRGHGRPMLH